MFGRDVFKTILRYFGRFFLVGLISFPGTILIGLLEQASPIFQGTAALAFYYFFCILFSYRRKMKDEDEKKRYRDCIIANKFYYWAESVRIVNDKFYTLATDAVAFWVLYIFSSLTLFRNSYFGFPNENETVTLVMHIVICITFPIFDILVNLFIRKKWFKEYDEFRKDKKYQEFQG